MSFGNFDFGEFSLYGILTLRYFDFVTGLILRHFHFETFWIAAAISRKKEKKKKKEQAEKMLVSFVERARVRLKASLATLLRADSSLPATANADITDSANLQVSALPNSDGCSN